MAGPSNAEGRKDPVAPDLVIAGAARSGTSFLAATLAHHPGIDQGSLKEPNYYSSKWSEGPEWYDALFEPRKKGLVRVDGSVSYTYPQHEHALERVRDANPQVQVVYTVREPVARLVSHYQLFRHYYGRSDWATLSEAMDRSAMFLGSGDYGHWLGRLRELFPLENVLVVPFPATTRDVGSTTALLLERLGLPVAAADLEAPTFRNEVRDFRMPALRSVHQRLQRSRVYPTLRSWVGPDRLRRIRQAATRPTTLPSRDEELASLSAAQRVQVDEAAVAATAAVTDWLAEQDNRLGLDWSAVWAEHTQRSPR
jgi:hypothetical protein